VNRLKNNAPIIFEKRKEKRKKEINRISIEYLTDEAQIHRSKKVNFGLTKDISLSGFKILTDARVPLNKVMKISLSLGKDYKTIDMIGQVRWIKSLEDETYEIGLEIVDTFRESICVLTGHLYGISD
jgi:hypothetical protein